MISMGLAHEAGFGQGDQRNPQGDVDEGGFSAAQSEVHAGNERGPAQNRAELALDAEEKIVAADQAQARAKGDVGQGGGGDEKQ